VKLVWTQRELDDRRAIFDYIETEDRRAAGVVDGRIAAATRRLSTFRKAAARTEWKILANWSLPARPILRSTESKAMSCGFCVLFMARVSGRTRSLMTIDDGAVETVDEFVRAGAGNARPADLLPFLDHAANEAVAASDER